MFVKKKIIFYINIANVEAIAIIENIMRHIAQVSGTDELQVREANFSPKCSEASDILNDTLSWAEYDKRRKEVDEFNKVIIVYNLFISELCNIRNTTLVSNIAIITKMVRINVTLFRLKIIYLLKKKTKKQEFRYCNDYIVFYFG